MLRTSVPLIGALDAMNSRVVAGLSLIVLMLCGYLVTFGRLRKNAELKAFANQFCEDLATWAESRGQAEEIYVDLTRRANKMQNALGPQGVMAHFRPPSANYIVPNVPIVVNFLPQAHTFFSDNWLRDRPLPYQYCSTIRDAVVRHLGDLDELEGNLRNTLRNPLRQLYIGIDALVAIPLGVLSSLGIIQASTAERAHSSRFFSLASAIAALITVVSGLVTIVVGWAEVLTHIKEWLGHGI